MCFQMVNTTTCLTPCQQFLNGLYFLIQLYIIGLFIHFMVTLILKNWVTQLVKKFTVFMKFF
jgi:hypothetical protein